jgi:NitT/TauT family transport system substrate-binding protein
MKKFRVKVCLAGVAAVLSLTAVSLPASADTTTTSSSSVQKPATPAPKPLATPVTINVSEGVSGATLAYLAPQLAQYFGEFAKENLTVNFTKTTDANATALLESNHLQAAVIGFGAGQFNALAGGGDFRWVLPFGRLPANDTTGIWARNSLLSKNGKFDACKLKTGVKNGTTVFDFGSAVGAGGPLITYYAALVSQCKGLTLQEALQKTTVGTVSGANLLVGLQTGSLDLSVLYDPLVSTPGLRGYASPVLLANKIPNVATQDVGGWVLSGDFMKSQPKAAAAFLRAVVRTERTYLQGNYLKNPATVQALASVTGLPVATVKTFTPDTFTPALMNSKVYIADLQKDWTEVGGQILSYTKPLTVNQVVSNTILKKVLAEK